ncbi:hypothetical protein PFICI_13853 [Pestalotiopsis fici W106-1]|uniref:Yippee domain-containing protein n=1 Tax=Pestalotiopsis fici (strain W106-1 / CGMCC3.15140) TaxID=1229662 RepID=W3WLE3_PESFW|nr:uncharacterized protein PFICI_13853 [Pestalotiopsis fici W106-1]ETS73987.1 hypothetical protein PFICI_13853 [Pestalotiopsis fici W106-1]
MSTSDKLVSLRQSGPRTPSLQAGFIGSERRSPLNQNGLATATSQPAASLKRTISEDLSSENESRRKKLVCLAQRLHVEVGQSPVTTPKSKYAPLSATVQTSQTPGSKSDLRKFGCKSCKTFLALYESIISRNFRGQHGKAYLFSNVENVDFGMPQEKSMTTGMHTLRDARCLGCGEVMGWKYDKAKEKSERYKEGKIVLEAELLCAV